MGIKKEEIEVLCRVILDKWLTDKTENLTKVSENARQLDSDLHRIEGRLLQIESVKLHVSIENQFMLTPQFQQALNQAYVRAEMEFAPIDRDRMSHYPTLVSGEVTEKEFGTTAGAREYILFFGLKVKYRGKDEGSFRLRVGDRNGPPFKLDSNTKEVIFMKNYILSPEMFIGISRISGQGTLRFRLLGVSITPNFFC